MPKIASSPSSVSTVPAGSPQTLPFLLTSQQGEAARTLLRYVASLKLPGPDAQLVAAVVAIRAARGGVGNLTGTDLPALRLGDARGAVDALRGLGWQMDDALFDGDPATPVPITVPDLARETGHPLPFGKNVRSRVSGWTTKTVSAKPVKKLPPAARLAGLFVAAYSTSKLIGQIPPDLPEICRATLPDLLRKGFLAELSEERCRLDPAVRHLSGMRPPTPEEQAAKLPEGDTEAVRPSTPGFQFNVDAWAQWKRTATPALRRHVESVEYCAVCALPPEQVAEAFMAPGRPQFFSKNVKAAYGEWKNAHPDRGLLAAEFTVAFRAEHGHGPSYRQLCSGLGWDVKHSLRGFIVGRLLANEWLTDTSSVPWTLRPGKAAQAEGIVLPKARSSAVSAHAGP
ncbi:hypothetical protein EES47_26140 [Streptomyces sp. ADI98-12]|uniref:hypothetical protein n=1 Tax=Streptomyces TaxID=1883 RepID=UPI000FBA5AF2|nr:hypothetical protein [Streptomyces sp. ADI98-12]RPK82346.1 hypothetical protein EES47_26140 [Streptomyces sp. ADI98-12]